MYRPLTSCKIDVEPYDNGTGSNGAAVKPILQVQGLSLSYGSQAVFKDVTLQSSPGSLTAIVGPSGCGKTSFLQCINRLVGLVPGSRVSGSVLLDGADVYSPEYNLVTLRRQVGMIFQKPAPFPFSIRRNFHLPLKEYGVKKKAERERLMQQALQQVGLWQEVRDRLNSSAINLSGGQQQRLCLARALALRPKVLLMDEPTSSLDPIAAGCIEELIKELKTSYMIIMVTHNLAQARRLGDIVALFWLKDGAGRLIEYAPTWQFFNAPQNETTAAYVRGVRG